MDLSTTFKNIYDKHSKTILLIPLILALLATFFIYSEYKQTNDFFNKDISLKGGISATIITEKEIDINALESDLSSIFKDAQVRKLSEFGSEKQIGIIIEIPETDENKFQSTLEEKLGIKLTEENFSIEVVGSSLGESFYQQIFKAILFAFILMAIVVLIAYRTIVPSLLVITCAFMDIFVTVGILDLFNVRISTAGIGALLLLIGYSIDTDMVLTTKVYRRKEGSIIDRFMDSFSTTMLMSLTSLIAVFIGLLLSTSSVLNEIFTVMTIGLIVDIIFTNLMNAPLIILYTKKKEKVNVN